MVKKISINKSSFRNENAYKKYIEKLVKKHNIVIETTNNQVDYWYNDKGLLILEEKAAERNMSLDEYMAHPFMDKKDLIHTKRDLKENTMKMDVYQDKIKYSIPENIYKKMEKEAIEKNITVRKLLENQMKELYETNFKKYH
jgi:hypothetical protein